MKILVVVHQLRGGGVERVISLLSQEWAKCHEVIIVSLDLDTSETPFDYGGRIIYLRTPAAHSFIRKIFHFVVRPARLLRLIRRERPDRIISFTEMANIPAILASALAGCLSRLSISTRDNPATFPWWYKLCMFSLHRLPARWVAVSEGVRRDLASTYRAPLEKTSFIPNPVVVKDPQDAARETAPPLPGRYILGIGRLVGQKRFDLLLRAFHLLGRPNLHLAILGEGPERESLLLLAHELELKNRLHLPGWVDDLEAWYRHAACFVLSSRHEGWPNVLMEALANRCPAVSFDCDYGASEILEGGKWGLLIPQGDVKALAGGIARVLDDDTLRWQLAARGPEQAKAFSTDKIAPCWLRGT